MHWSGGYGAGGAVVIEMMPPDPRAPRAGVLVHALDHDHPCNLDLASKASDRVGKFRGPRARRGRALQDFIPLTKLSTDPFCCAAKSTGIYRFAGPSPDRALLQSWGLAEK